MGSGPREWLFVFDIDYSETPDPRLTMALDVQPEQPLMYWICWARRNSNAWGTDGEYLDILTTSGQTESDTYDISTAGLEMTKSADIAKDRLESINVFPNPYFGHNVAEDNFFTQFVTFNNLPEECTIRIFSLSGSHVMTIVHDNGTPFERWYLLNEEQLPVASGMYIIHIETEFGDKILKLGVVNREGRYQHI